MADLSGLGAVCTDASPALVRHRAFYTLDALRGIAAIAVVLFHAGFAYGIAPPAEGQIAVDLFFVVSGFIIASRYERELQSGLGVIGFLRIRMIRLYPLCLLGSLVGAIPAIVAVTGGHASSLYQGLVASIPLAILVLPSPFALPQLDTLYPLNYVVWTLALEILVNVAYAATCRFWTLKRLRILVAASFGGLATCAFFYATLDVGFAWSHALGGFARVLFGFGTGILIFRLRAARLISLNVAWWVAPVLFGIAVFVDPTHVAVAWFRPAYELILVTVFVPLVVVVAIFNEPPTILRGTCATVGVFSYVLYSMHAPFIGLFLRLEDRLHAKIGMATSVKAIAFSVGLGALCMVAHFAFDRPARRLLARLGPPRDVRKKLTALA